MNVKSYEVKDDVKTDEVKDDIKQGARPVVVEVDVRKQFTNRCS